MRSIVISACLSVCLQAYLRKVRTSLNTRCMLSVAAARSSATSDDNTMRYVLPVLWMTSRLPPQPAGLISSRAACSQVVNRTTLCRLLNGTCVVPAHCAVLGLTLGYDLGRGRSSSDVGKYFSCDESATVCCYPFLLSSLQRPSLAVLYPGRRGAHSDDDEDDRPGGFETVYEYWYPRHASQRGRRLQRRERGRYGRTSRGRYHDQDSSSRRRRRYETDRRSSLFGSVGRTLLEWSAEQGTCNGPVSVRLSLCLFRR